MIFLEIVVHAQKHSQNLQGFAFVLCGNNKSYENEPFNAFLLHFVIVAVRNFYSSILFILSKVL